MQIRNIESVAVLAIMILATVTSETSVSTTCEAVYFFGKHIVICAIPPTGTLFLLHSRNSEQQTPDPAYHCTWIRDRPRSCWGTDGFDFYVNESDAERVAFQIPQDFVRDFFFCNFNDGRPFKNCSFNDRDMNVSVSSTSTSANSNFTSTTAAPCLCSSHTTEFWIVLVVLVVTVVLLSIVVIISVQFYRKRSRRRRQSTGNTGIEERVPMNGLLEIPPRRMNRVIL